MQRVVPASIIGIVCSVLFAIQSSSAAVQASITVEQISPEKIGVWTLLHGDGSSLKSTEKGINQLKYSFSITDFSPKRFSVEPPFGMHAKILVYRGGELVATVKNYQYSFTPYGNDVYRFLVQYSVAPTGSLGITSDPANVQFRLKGGDKTRTGTTPTTLTNLPAGKYTIDVLPPKGCIKPSPRTVAVKSEERNTTMITVNCLTTEDTSSVSSSRVSKRSIVESAQARELKKRGQRK
jgi:hypothetical protein